MAIELATAYVSLVGETSKLEKSINDAFKGIGKSADLAGKDMGGRIARTASKALQDGWRPDQDIMAGIPNARLDRVGARIGQVIGKGVVGGLKAQQLGREFGSSFASGAGSIGLGSVISGWRSDLSGQSNKLGYVAGKALSAGLTAAVGVGVAGVGLALKSGFDRLVALDTAQYKLRQILKSSGQDEKQFDKIYKSIQASVDKTPFSLDQAFGTAVQAIGAGAQDIERFMTNVADAAGFAGTDLERMGLIFTQVLAKGKLTGEETMQLMEAGLPARSWIQKSYNLTAEQFDDMQQKGEITLDMLQKSIEDHAPGMAKALGNTLQGSIDNMQTALARTGANLLAAIFGGPTGDATEGLKSAVQRITEMLERLNNWIVANRDTIREYFNAAKDIALDLTRALGEVARFLKEHPGLVQAVAGAFVAWKSIQGVTSLLTTLNSLSTLLRVTLPASAATGAAAMSASYAPLLATLGRLIPLVGFAAVPNTETYTDEQMQQQLGELGYSSEQIANLGFGVSIPGGGGPNASRERRGLEPINPAADILGGMAGTTGGNVTGGGLHGGPVPGTAGRGFLNSRRASQFLDARTDAALLSRVPSGVYSQTESADLTQGLADCSSAIEDLVNIIDGRPTAGRSMSTANAHQWLTSRGFMPGTRPGAFNVGFNSGHMQATLPGGTPFNWGSGSAAANRGIGGSGAFDPAFTAQYYRYDTGGWLPPGTTMVENETGKPELILNPEQQDQLAQAGVDPNTLLHGAANAAPPGPVAEDAPNVGLDDAKRMGGFVPTAAGNTGVAGTSSLAGILNLGNEVVGGLIDTGVSLAQTAISAAATAGAAGGTMGAGAAAGPAAGAAASYGLQVAAQVGKRLSSYGFQLASIGADSLIAQIMPFGAPRWIGYDYTQFAPSVSGLMEAGTSSLEQMGGQAIRDHFAKQNPAATLTDPSQAPGAGPDAPPSGQNPFGGAVGGSAAMPPMATGTATAPLPVPPVNVYDTGGVLHPGTLAFNASRRPERVLTDQQWKAIGDVTAGRDAPMVQIGSITGFSPEDVATKIESKQKLAMMRYSGRP